MMDDLTGDYGQNACSNLDYRFCVSKYMFPVRHVVVKPVERWSDAPVSIRFTRGAHMLPLNAR